MVSRCTEKSHQTVGITYLCPSGLPPAFSSEFYVLNQHVPAPSADLSFACACTAPTPLSPSLLLLGPGVCAPLCCVRIDRFVRILMPWSLAALAQQIEEACKSEEGRFFLWPYRTTTVAVAKGTQIRYIIRKIIGKWKNGGQWGEIRDGKWALTGKMGKEEGK